MWLAPLFLYTSRLMLVGGLGIRGVPLVRTRPPRGPDIFGFHVRSLGSTPPVLKGRRGGSSILKPRPSRVKIAGKGMKKKPKVHGEHMSRVLEKKRAEEKGKRDIELWKAMKKDGSIPYEF